jgi:hypothetical protein
VDLSVFGDDDVRELVDPFFENPEKAVQHPGSAQGRFRRPVRGSLARRRDGICDIRRVRDRQ